MRAKQQSQPPQDEACRTRQRFLFWAVFWLSIYCNVHYIVLQAATTSTMSVVSHPPPSLSKSAFIMTAPKSSSLQKRSILYRKKINKTQELIDLVDFVTPEMVLRTAWQGLTKQRSKKTPYRVLTNVWPRTAGLDYGPEDFSLSTHGTVGRLDRLLEEYLRWDGPVSAALYISTEQEIDMFIAFVQTKGHLMTNMAIHVLMEDLSFMSKQYPNNILRNLAMSQLETNYFVALDVDFVTNVGAHGHLRTLMQQYPTLTSVLRNKTLLVLPAFESAMNNVTYYNATGHLVWQEQIKTMEAPHDKRDLIQQYDRGIVDAFHFKHFPPGHGPTRFNIWFDNRTGPLYPITYHKRFEPYVLAYRHGLPDYWTGFRGYFFNKYSFFFECYCMGYEFAVLRDFFVFHVGKSGGGSRIPKWKSIEWAKFLDYKQRMWGNRTVTEYGGYQSIY